MPNDTVPAAELLMAVARGDRSAFRELYDSTAPRMYGIAFRVLRRSDLADEAVQEGYLRVWRQAARFDPARGSVMAWLATIVRRVSLDRLPPEREHQDLDQVTIAIDLVGAAHEPRLGGCLAALEPRQREAFLLAYLDGLTHSELAQHLGVPLGTAKSWVRRATMGLRRCMEGE